jgi:Flp pilus assembly protein TadB
MLDNSPQIDTVRTRARQRVEQQLGLAVHWAVYLAVNIGLIIAAGGLAGSGWRLAGWGIGLAAHTLYVLVNVGDLRERMIQRAMDRESGKLS